MNRLDFLARRLCEHLQAGVENFVARQSQVGVATAEQHREQLGKVLVDDIEGVLQQVAGFAVDAFDRIFQRVDSLVQIE